MIFEEMKRFHVYYSPRGKQNTQQTYVILAKMMYVKVPLKARYFLGSGGHAGISVEYVGIKKRSKKFQSGCFYTRYQNNYWCYCLLVSSVLLCNPTSYSYIYNFQTWLYRSTERAYRYQEKHIININRTMACSLSIYASPLKIKSACEPIEQNAVYYKFIYYMCVTFVTHVL